MNIDSEESPKAVLQAFAWLTVLVLAVIGFASLPHAGQFLAGVLILARYVFKA